MNIQSLKLNLIDWLIHLKDEAFIREVQAIRKKEFIKKYEEGLKPLSDEEILRRIEQSEDDFKNGRFSSLENFIKEKENW